MNAPLKQAYRSGSVAVDTRLETNPLKIVDGLPKPRMAPMPVMATSLVPDFNPGHLADRQRAGEGCKIVDGLPNRIRADELRYLRIRPIDNE